MDLKGEGGARGVFDRGLRQNASWRGERLTISRMVNEIRDLSEGGLRLQRCTEGIQILYKGIERV